MGGMVREMGGIHQSSFSSNIEKLRPPLSREYVSNCNMGSGVQGSSRWVVKRRGLTYYQSFSVQVKVYGLPMRVTRTSSFYPEAPSSPRAVSPSSLLSFYLPQSHEK